MKTLIEVECENQECRKRFHKTISQYNLAQKRGYKHCCSRSCACLIGNKANPRKGNPNIKKESGNQRDELTPFRWFSTVLKTRSVSKTRTNKEVDIDLEYIRFLWEKQKGKCPYTGWDLVLPQNTNGWIGKQPINGASLDRIDNSLGYVKGNVQFVSVMANLAKNRYSDDELIVFCKAVSENRG
jgi:hypothetical protein